jgi:hypothetical protein
MRLNALLLVAALAVAGAGSLHAGTCLYGISGLVETPDDTIADPSAVTFEGRYIAHFADSKTNVFSYGGTIGILPTLEVGAIAFDTDAPGHKVEGIFNVKYRVMEESFDRPSVTVGALDVANRLGRVISSAYVDKVSGFLVVGRNLASAAQSWGSLVSKPLKGTLGFGTGIYRGVFVGLDWSASSKVDLMAEYLTRGLRQKSTLNAGLRLNAAGGLSVEVGTIGFKDIYGGASYTLSTY